MVGTGTHGSGEEVKGGRVRSGRAGVVVFGFNVVVDFGFEVDFVEVVFKNLAVVDLVGLGFPAEVEVDAEDALCVDFPEEGLDRDKATLLVVLDWDFDAGGRVDERDVVFSEAVLLSPGAVVVFEDLDGLARVVVAPFVVLEGAEVEEGA